MEVERDVKFQIVGREKDPEGNLRAGFSSGPHASPDLPGYSKGERMLYLGPNFVDRVQLVFAPAQDSDQGKAANVVAMTPMVERTLRDGW